jgi:hypothetical protein
MNVGFPNKANNTRCHHTVPVSVNTWLFLRHSQSRHNKTSSTLGITISDCAGFPCNENCSFSSWRCIMRSPKLMESFSYLSTVKFIVGCILVNPFKVCSMLLLFWPWNIRIPYHHHIGSGLLFFCAYWAFTVASCAKGWRDNHDLILPTSLYCMRYRTYTNERWVASVSVFSKFFNYNILFISWINCWPTELR